MGRVGVGVGVRVGVVGTFSCHLMERAGDFRMTSLKSVVPRGKRCLCSAVGKAAGLGREATTGRVCGTPEETMAACVYCAMKTRWPISRHDVTESSNRPVR